MSRKIGLTSLTLILLAVLGGFWQPGLTEIIFSGSSPDPHQVAVMPPQSSAINPQLVKAQTQFGLKLFQALRHQTPQENIVISPTSIATALSMAYNGAGGQTQQEMINGLALQGMSLAEINTASQGLQTALEQADRDVKLTLANSLWVREGFPLKPDFVATSEKFYHGVVTPLDFTRPTAVKTINEWVSQKTQGRIQQIVDQLKAEDVLFLINAVYFKGNWTTPFNPARTENQPFHLADGEVKSHPFMVQSDQYAYLETPDFQAVSLPYGKNGRFSFDIFLPAPGSNLNTFLNEFTPEKLQTWTQQFNWRYGLISLPRFQTAYEVTLNDALKSLGMKTMFDRNQADFSQLTDETVAIDAVKHKTFLEVNEEGTEAAAATSIGVVATSAPSEPFRLIIDRPFLCLIRDHETGTLLFVGAIYEP